MVMARIFLAEDDTSMREYLQRALQRVGYEVQAVGCGTEAMPLLETERFDLVMTPVFDHFTRTKIAFIRTHCHQVHGRFSGWVVPPDGRRREIKDMLAFCEHAENRW
jgi:hypothetical protein